MSPGHLVEYNLNYWYRDCPTPSAYQLITFGDLATAVTKETITPYSNLRLLEEVLGGIDQKYGVGEVLVDYKFHHSLTGTHMRLIVPEKRRVITDTGVDDDTWSVGLEINNSLTGDGFTEIIGYLFRWWCTNGQTTIHDGTRWNRKKKNTETDVYAWARDSVDAILGGLEGELDQVQESVEMDLTGNFDVMAANVFKKYSIPLAQQKSIRHRLVDEGSFTMYHLTQAITATANDSSLKPHEVSRLLRAGGDLPHQHTALCDLGSLHLQDEPQRTSDEDDD
jgi:hypothetical protein